MSGVDLDAVFAAAKKKKGRKAGRKRPRESVEAVEEHEDDAITSLAGNSTRETSSSTGVKFKESKGHGRTETMAGFVAQASSEAAPDNATRSLDLDGAEDDKTIGNSGPTSSKPKKPSKLGPLRAPSNVRSTTVMEYKLGICKDYFETGICGRGETCIFLHDRSRMKQSYQLDREWDEMQKAKEEEVQRKLQGKSAETTETEETDAKRARRAPAAFSWSAVKAQDPVGSAATQQAAWVPVVLGNSTEEDKK